jgi:choline dehydrogenase
MVAGAYLLEAGLDYGHPDEGRRPSDLLDSSTIPESHDWGYTSGLELPGRQACPTSGMPRFSGGRYSHSLVRGDRLAHRSRYA